MIIIPVLDLMQGQAVHARQGQRDQYRPLASRLCSSSEPLAVAQALFDALHCPYLYVADLDAILGEGDHDAVLARIKARLPAVTLLVDRGFRDRQSLARWLDLDLGRPVLGSETMPDAAWLRMARNLCTDRPALLSLDFREHGFVGPADLLRNSETWPEDVIAMALPNVGSDQGPAVDRVQELLQRGAQRVLAAGGVRGLADLARLKDAGAAGALIASALHDGRLDPAALTAFQAESCVKAP